MNDPDVRSPRTGRTEPSNRSVWRSGAVATAEAAVATEILGVHACATCR